MKYGKRKNYAKRKKNTRKPRLTLDSVNTKIKKIQKAIEYKHLDTFYNDQVGLGGNVYPVSNPPQGLLDVNRVGDKITITSVMLKMILTQYDAPYNTFRVLILRSQSSAAAPSINNVFLVGSGPQAKNPAAWFYNLDFFRSSKAKVLYDRTYTLQGLNSAEPRTITLSKKIPFRQNVQFQGATTIANNQLYVMVVTDSANIPHPDLVINTRINYFDL